MLLPGKRKHLILADSLGASEAEALVKESINRGVDYQLVQIEDRRDTLLELLSSQKMGTFLYFLGSWEQLNQIKSMAEESGFSADEALYKGIGQPEKRIFCCRCHGLSISKEQETDMHCQQCGLQLEISVHYSPLRDAYLGYPLKL